MSAIDHRLPFAVLLGYGRRAKPYEGRMPIKNWEKCKSKEVLIAMCINSVELCLACGVPESRILSLLCQVMNLKPKNHDYYWFEQVPDWMKLSKLPIRMIVDFKGLLATEIERLLITQIDDDPDVWEIP